MSWRTILTVVLLSVVAVAVAAVVHDDNSFDRREAEAFVREAERPGADAREVRCTPAFGARWNCRYRVDGGVCEATVSGGDRPEMHAIC